MDDRHLQLMEPPDDVYDDDVGPAPTYNTPAEQALLGAILAEPEIAPTVIDDLDPGDFHRIEHETIWTAITTLVSENRTTDPAHVLEYLQRSGELARIGGGNYLHTLYHRSAGTTSPEQAHDYARIILDASRLRKAGQIATRLSQVVRAARADTIDDALAQALDDLDHAAGRLGATRATAATGLRDLSWLEDGTPPHVDPPTWGRRSCGNALFYPGRLNGVFGDPEAAKSWLAQICVVEALAAGQRAAIVDVDHNGMELTAERLLLLGARPDHLADRGQFRYHDPDDGGEVAAAVASLADWRPAVVVLDSLGELVPMVGKESNSNDDLTMVLRGLARPLLKVGSCVITIDHLAKAHEARGNGFAIGGMAKKRAIDGTYLHAETRTPAAPGQVGRITLRVEKDRAGRLRATCTGKYVGTLTLDSTHPHTITVRIGTEDSPLGPDGHFRPTHLMEAVSRFVEQNDQCTQTRIEESIRGKRGHVRTALNRLVDEGYVTQMDGPRNSTLHHSVALYREAEDDQA